MKAPRIAGRLRLFLNQEFVLPLALAVLAVLNGAMGAYVVACQAVGALIAPLWALVLDADVLKRTDFLATPTPSAFVRRVEEANARKVAVEEGTEDVTL